jgi:hypothetical protein
MAAGVPEKFLGLNMNDNRPSNGEMVNLPRITFVTASEPAQITKLAEGNLSLADV